MIGQGLIGNQKQITSKAEVSKKTSKSVLGGAVDLFNGSGLVTETTVSNKLLKANVGWVYKNNDVIAKEVSSIEFELFTTRIVGQDIVFTPILSHPLLDLLDRFNEFTAASDGFYLTSSHKTLAGDAFWLLEGNAPTIRSIYILQPDKVTLKLGEAIAGQRIIQGYEFSTSVQGETIKKVYDAEEVIHFKNPDPNNQYRGKSKVEAAAEAIDTDNYAIEANKGFFKRGLITNFILSTDNKLTSEQLKQLRAELRSNYAGASNAYKAMILSGGLKPESIQMTNKDMEFIEQQRWLRDKIMSIFGNVQSVLGISEDVNRANADATILNWKRTTIKQEMKSICDTLNEFLVPKYGSNLVLGFKDPVPEDRTTKVDEAVKLVGAKIITQNEARESIGLDPSKEEGTDSLNVAQNIVNQAPKSLQNVNLVKHLRSSGVFRELQKNIESQEIKIASRQIAEKIVKSRKKQQPVTVTKSVEVSQEHEAFTNEQVWAFHNKQINVVEALESVFENKVQRYINGLVERALEQVPNELPQTKNKALFDQQEEVQRAVIDFTPILMEAGLLAGNQALQFINSDQTYLGANIRETIAANVRKFAGSMIDTDREKMIDILAQGVSDGLSVPQIKKQIRDYFADYSKVQAERVTRSEVLRASNLATIDAWEQSGVVVGKQWLTAEDERVCPYCAPMNGQIVDLKTVFFKKGTQYYGDSDTPLDLSYGSVKGGNLHVSCRCTLLPVLVSQKSFNADSYLKIQELETQKTELEAKLDKRTKKYRELKDQNLSLENHVTELEKIVDEISSEN